MQTRSGKTLQQGKITSHFGAPLNTHSGTEPVTSITYSTIANTKHTQQRTTMSTADNSASDEDHRPVSNDELKQLIQGMEARLSHKFDKLQLEMNELKDRVTKNEADIRDLEAAATDTSCKTDDIVKKTIPEIDQKYEKRFADIEKENLKREMHDRKYNLLFYGVPQAGGEEQLDLDPKMRQIFISDFGVKEEDVNGLYLVNIHRLPRRNVQQDRDPGPDPIIIRFGCMADVNVLLDGQRHRPYYPDRKPVMAYTDLPGIMKRERGRLVQHAKKLRQEGHLTRIRTVGLAVLLEYRRKGFGGQWKRFVPEV